MPSAQFHQYSTKAMTHAGPQSKVLLLTACLLISGCSEVKVAGTQNSDTTSSSLSNDANVVNAFEFSDEYNRACIDSNVNLVVCPATDMAKIAKNVAIEYEHEDYDWSNGPVQLHAARNETIAFQLLLKNRSGLKVQQLNLELGSASLVNADISNTSSNGNISAAEGTTNSNALAEFHQTVFSAFYHPVDNAGYTSGPPTPVLPWPAEYPDALVHTGDNCSSSNNQSKVDLAIPERQGANQAVWIDTYIPKTAIAGTYQQTLSLTIDDEVIELPIQITVHNAQLPDEPSINAVGELYRSYNLEGVGFDMTSLAWREMSQCYQQLAHQHRLVFIERVPEFLTGEQLGVYADTIDPALTGELFDSNAGYVGPGESTPVKIWRTPWPQTLNAQTTQLLDQAELDKFQDLSREWNTLVDTRGWQDTDYFAYVFDEVDGPRQMGLPGESRDDYVARVHSQMARVQSAIDAGTQDESVDLIWTSHSNPAIWQDDPNQDLTNIIRLWAPNASAADTNFLQSRIDAGEQAWFYHSGHPAVGAHSINVSGIEMRTWGVIGARYNFQGQFMWAVNLGSDDFPFRDPQFSVTEDRAGNGVLVYPGNQLDKIGYESSPGPVPSMRLKSWRRGLQDAELFYLANARNPELAKTILNAQIPTALTEGSGNASWPNTAAPWIDFHKALLEMASSP